MSARPDPDPRFRARVRRGAGAALVLVLLGLAAAVLVTALTPRGETTILAPGAGADPTAADGATANPSSESAQSPAIFVHILGQVTRPGLYELREGDRAVDAVAAAGGFTETADPGAVNLARFVSDGEQIVVPAIGEAAASGAAAEASGKVNLNTADAVELETLPRIGPAIAERIIAWRDENGPFATIEDLLEVSGIGERTIEQLRELVTT